MLKVEWGGDGAHPGDGAKPGGVVGASYVGWSGATVQHGAIEFPRELAASIGLSRSGRTTPAVVFVQCVPPRDCPNATHVELVPLGVDDWEIIELHATHIEHHLLAQVGAVARGQAIPVWVPTGGSTREVSPPLVRLIVRALDAGQREPKCARLTKNTVVTISGKRRHVGVPGATRPSPDCWRREAAVLRVLAMAHFHSRGVPACEANAFVVVVHPDLGRVLGMDRDGVAPSRPARESGSRIAGWMSVPYAALCDARRRRRSGNADGTNVERGPAALLKSRHRGDRCIIVRVRFHRCIPRGYIAIPQAIRANHGLKIMRNAYLRTILHAPLVQPTRAFSGDTDRRIRLLLRLLQCDMQCNKKLQRKCLVSLANNQSGRGGKEAVATLLLRLMWCCHDSTKTVDFFCTSSPRCLPRECAPPTTAVACSGSVNQCCAGNGGGTFVFRVENMPENDRTASSLKVEHDGTARSMVMESCGLSMSNISRVGQTATMAGACVRAPANGASGRVDCVFAPSTKVAVAHVSPALMRNVARTRIISFQSCSPGSLLVHGKAGSGKTTFVSALARRFHNDAKSLAYAIRVRCRRLRAQKRMAVKSVFEDVWRQAESMSPAIVILDDLGALCPSQSHVVDAQAQWLAESLASLVNRERESNEAQHHAWRYRRATLQRITKTNEQGEAVSPRPRFGVAVVGTLSEDPHHALHPTLLRSGVFDASGCVALAYPNEDSRRKVLEVLLTQTCATRKLSVDVDVSSTL